MLSKLDEAAISSPLVQFSQFADLQHRRSAIAPLLLLAARNVKALVHISLQMKPRGLSQLEFKARALMCVVLGALY